MRRLSLYFALHGLALLIYLLPGKLIKATRLVPALALNAHYKLLLPDLAMVLFLEIFLLGLCLLAGQLGGRILRAILGLLTVIIGVYIVSDARFLVATGSIMDWSMFWYGIKNLGDLGGTVRTELPGPWLAAMLSPILVGGAFGAWGMQLRVSGPFRRLPGLGLLLVSLLGMWGLAFKGTVKAADGRLEPVRRNLFMTVASSIKRDLTLTWKGDVTIDAGVALPEPLRIQPRPDTRRMNVVLILLESQRAMATTPYNPTLDSTPFLDRMAREGLMIERAYTALPHTTKCIVPVMCGYPPDIRWSLTEILPDALPVRCLPQLLREQGYRTAFFTPSYGSFEKNDVLVKTIGIDTYVPAEKIEKKHWESPNYLGLEDRSMLEPIQQWLSAGPEPFFLSVLTLVSHHDYKVPTTFAQKDYGVSERWSNYLNTLRYVDSFNQELFQIFENKGLLDNTLFIFVGDHGEGHGEHGRKGHDEIAYEEGVRIPLIFWNKKLIPQPERVEGLRQQKDIMPTVLQLLGYDKVAGSFDGQSLLEPADGRVLFSSCFYEDRCLARWEGNLKFIHYMGNRPDEYYDLGKDPDERNNLIKQLPEKTQKQWIKEALEWRTHYRSVYARQRLHLRQGYISYQKPKASRRLDALVEQHLQFFGYDLARKASVGSPASITLYAAVLKNLGANWKYQLELQDGRGKVHRVPIKKLVPDDPYNSLAPGQYIRQELHFDIPKGANTGKSHLHVFVNGPKGAHRPMRGLDVNQQQRWIDLTIRLE